MDIDEIARYRKCEQVTGILRFVPGRVGSQPLDSLPLCLVCLEDLNLAGHEGVLILDTILLVQLLTPSFCNGCPHF